MLTLVLPCTAVLPVPLPTDAFVASSNISTLGVALPPLMSSATEISSGLPAESLVTGGWVTWGGMVLPTPPSM